MQPSPYCTQAPWMIASPQTERDAILASLHAGILVYCLTSKTAQCRLSLITRGRSFAFRHSIQRAMQPLPLPTRVVCFIASQETSRDAVSASLHAGSLLYYLTANTVRYSPCLIARGLFGLLPYSNSARRSLRLITRGFFGLLPHSKYYIFRVNHL